MNSSWVNAGNGPWSCCANIRLPCRKADSMENKAHALAAGIFVVVVTILLVVLAAWLTRDTGQRDIYEISTRETITGLQSQAAVRYRGVDVGKVGSIGFDPKAQGNVLIRLEVDHEAPVTQDTFA